MMRSFKANRDLLKRKSLKDTYEKYKNTSGPTDIGNSLNSQDKKMSAGKFKEFRLRLLEERLREKHKRGFILFLTIVIVVAGLWYLLFQYKIGLQLMLWGFIWLFC